jgi:hypothetical protein
MKEVTSTINIASYMTTQRSYADFIRVCNELLTDFFSFEAVGILFRDKIDDSLFQIQLIKGEEDHPSLWLRKNRERKGEELTFGERKDEVERQYRVRNAQKYPNTLGVTGEVFHSGKMIWTNKVSELGNYVPSIDNMSADVKDVHSLVICPIWGHANKGDVKSDSEKPVGCM